MILFVIISAIIIFLFIIECSVYGYKNYHQPNYLRELLKDGYYHKYNLIHLSNGYIARPVFIGYFFSYYYNEMFTCNKVISRIWFWNPIYKEIRTLIKNTTKPRDTRYDDKSIYL